MDNNRRFEEFYKLREIAIENINAGLPYCSTNVAKAGYKRCVNTILRRAFFKIMETDDENFQAICDSFLADLQECKLKHFKV